VSKKKRTIRKRKRAASMSSKRARAANPMRRRRVARRARAANPKRYSRARRRNPSGGKSPAIKSTIVAILAAGGAFVATQALGYLAPGDPVANGTRNRVLAAAALAVGGAMLLKRHPSLALSVAAGAALGAVGGHLTVKMFQYLPAKKPTQQAAVFADPMAAVYADEMQGMGAAYAQIGDYSQIGAIRPPAPWLAATPFN